MDIDTPEPASEGLAAQFAARVATRDVPAPPVPPSQTVAAITGRLSDWLLTRYQQRDRRSRYALTQMLLLLLQQPDAPTAALQAAAGLGPRMSARATLRLSELGITEWFYRSRTRYHRLTRAAEDVLVGVVDGSAGGV